MSHPATTHYSPALALPPGIPETCPPGEGHALVLPLHERRTAIRGAAAGSALPAGRAATGTGRRPHAPAPHGAQHRTQSRPRRRRLQRRLGRLQSSSVVS